MKGYVCLDTARSRSAPALAIDMEKLKSIAHPMRLRILKLLSMKPMYPKELAKRLGTEEFKAYYHVKRLEEAGLLTMVEARRIRGALAKLYSVDYKAIIIITNEDGWIETPLPGATRIPGLLLPFIRGGSLDARIVLGSPDPHGPFRARARDHHLAVELATFLGSLASIPWDSVLLDTEIMEEELKGNLIVVGGPTVNMVADCINRYLPIFFDTARENQVASKISGRRYYEDYFGIVELIENPFDPGRYVLIVAGKGREGTRAAILSLVRYPDEVSRGNAFNPSFVAHVVEGMDVNGDGKIDDVEIAE